MVDYAVILKSTVSALTGLYISPSSNNEEVNRLFSLSSPNIIRHIPNPYNIYKGKLDKTSGAE